MRPQLSCTECGAPWGFIGPTCQHLPCALWSPEFKSGAQHHLLTVPNPAPWHLRFPRLPMFHNHKMVELWNPVPDWTYNCFGKLCNVSQTWCYMTCVNALNLEVDSSKLQQWKITVVSFTVHLRAFATVLIQWKFTSLIYTTECHHVQFSVWSRKIGKKESSFCEIIRWL